MVARSLNFIALLLLVFPSGLWAQALCAQGQAERCSPAPQATEFMSSAVMACCQPMAPAPTEDEDPVLPQWAAPACCCGASPAPEQEQAPVLPRIQVDAGAEFAAPPLEPVDLQPAPSVSAGRTTQDEVPRPPPRPLFLLFGVFLS